MADQGEQHETSATTEPNNNEENDNNNNVGQQPTQQQNEQQTTTTPTLTSETQTEESQPTNQIQAETQNQLFIERPPALPPRPPNLVLPHAAIPPNAFPPPMATYHGKKIVSAFS